MGNSKSSHYFGNSILWTVLQICRLCGTYPIHRTMSLSTYCWNIIIACFCCSIIFGTIFVVQNFVHALLWSLLVVSLSFMSLLACLLVSHILKDIKASTGNSPAILNWRSCQVISGYTEPCHYHIWWPIKADCACITANCSLIPLEYSSYSFISGLKAAEP